MTTRTLTDAQRAALATRLRRGRDTAPDQIPRRRPGLSDLPLSYGQEQLWFIDRVLPVPGDHYQFLRPPLVAEVATTMEKWHGDPA